MAPALEAKEVLRLFEGKKANVEPLEKGMTMAGVLLEMAGKAKDGEGFKKAKKIWESGKAYKKFKEIIKAQGGNPNIKSEDIKIGKLKYVLNAKKSGRIHFMNTKLLSNAARLAGAPHDKKAGIMLCVEKGDRIKKGDKVLTIHAESKRKLDAAKELLTKYSPVELTKIILEEYDDKGPKIYA